MKLSIIIVNWNTGNLLRNCLRSIYENYGPADFEVIVVDNDSKDGSPRMVGKDFPEIKLIKNKENMGFSKANNQAIEICRGDYVLILNPDIIIKKNAIENMLEFLNVNNDAGAAGAKFLNPDGSVQKAGYYRRSPSIIQILLFYTILNRIFRHFPGICSRYWENDDMDNRHEVDQIPGACVLVKREVLEKTGGFDEDYFIWYEDVDWCFRIKRAGWKLYYCHDAEMVHYGGQSFINVNSGEKIILFYAGLLKYFQKNHSKTDYFLARSIITVNFLIVNTAQILMYPFAAKKRGIWRDNISARWRFIKNA
ncbi:MAG: glycosyltransferase family 2 protein [bacterium]